METDLVERATITEERDRETDRHKSKREGERDR